ncbi:hypothetical protein BDW67DRAFT_150205 [Aspergillus spinulosporus]
MEDGDGIWHVASSVFLLALSSKSITLVSFFLFSFFFSFHNFFLFFFFPLDGR